MDYECRITRSCIYWDPEKREIHDFIIEADSLEEASSKLYQKAMRLEFSTASKLIQDILIKKDGEWVPYDSIAKEG